MKINGRRDNGEGTQIRKRKDRDLYMQVIQIDGKRTKVYGKTKKEVRAKVKALKQKSDAGVVGEPGTVSDYLIAWHGANDATRLAKKLAEIEVTLIEEKGIGCERKRLTSGRYLIFHRPISQGD